jgi:hypothetical protein
VGDDVSVLATSVRYQQEAVLVALGVGKADDVRARVRPDQDGTYLLRVRNQTGQVVPNTERAHAMNIQTAQRIVPWSYSKIKNYEDCPKKHSEVDILKNFKDESEALTWGNTVHATLAKVLTGHAQLPPEMEHYAPWVDRVRNRGGKLLVEQKYAITNDFKPCSWFGDKRVWYRGIGDAVNLISDDIAAITDWKTGKPLEDHIQMFLMAQCIFTYYPKVQRAITEFVWLKEDCSTPRVYTRAEVAAEWTALFPRVNAYAKAVLDQNFPPKPNRRCKWCPVLSCPHQGK